MVFGPFRTLSGKGSWKSPVHGDECGTKVRGLDTPSLKDNESQWVKHNKTKPTDRSIVDTKDFPSLEEQ